MAWQRYIMAAVLVFFVFAWFHMPRVTKKDSVAWAEALFLEHCMKANLNPTTFEKPTFTVEGGDKDLIYTYHYKNKYNERQQVEVQISRMGEHVTRTLLAGASLMNKPKVTPSVGPAATAEAQNEEGE